MEENIKKEKNFLSAVVYVHNDKDKIEKFFNMLYQKLEEKFIKFEIIFVNDFSTDNSVEIIRRIAQKQEHVVVSILNMSFYQGVELSMNAGKKLAIGDFVYEFDYMDIDYEDTLVIDAYQKLLEGYDIVGVAPQNNFKFYSKVFYRIFNHYSNVQYDLETEVFRILSRRAINRVDSSSNAIPYRKAIYANCGLKCGTVFFKPKQNSDKVIFSREQTRQRGDTALKALILHTNIAYRISISMTLLLMLLTFTSVIYTIVIFFTGSPVVGWTTTMLVISFGFLGLFGVLSIVIRYLSLILELNFKKQEFVFESIEKISK